MDRLPSQGALKIREKDFGEVVSLLREFLMPPSIALAKKQLFEAKWQRGGPWR